jgi:hypothetical protein
MNRTVRSLILVLALLLAPAIPGCHGRKGDAPPKPAETPVVPVDGAAAAGPVLVELFVMSQCPYAVQAEQAFGPVLRQFGSEIDFRLHFVGVETEEGELATMHGDDELVGNLLQVCAQKVARDRLLDLLSCMNRDMGAIPGNFDDCATELGVDGAAIKACADSEEGVALLKASFRYGDELGVEGSPTVLISGAPYEGPRTGESLGRAVCESFQGVRPEACKALPEPMRVPLTVLSDVRCEACPNLVDMGIRQLRAVFPGLDVRVVDYGTDEGKALHGIVRDSEMRFLPAFLFAAEVEKDPSYEMMDPYFTDAGEWRVLAVDAPFDPEAEICDNGVDDNGNGKIDCKDPTCAESLICRPETPGTLDVFVMSHCPYALLALGSMKEVLEALGRDVKFKVRFIAEEVEPGEFVALHGPEEIAENIRQLCAQKHFGKGLRFLDYIWCRNAKMGEPDWEKCATGTIRPATMRKCASGPEGRKLLSADLKVGQGLGVNASPTWLVNNRQPFQAIAAEDIKQGFCKANPGWKGCDKTLSSDLGLPTGGCQAE